jgi:hypothetical protein
MKALVSTSVILAFACLAQVAAAETEQLSSTNYFVIIDPGEVIDQPNGRKITIGGRTQGTLVHDTGATDSIWCDFMNYLNEAGAATKGVGYCRSVTDNGDTLWLSFVQQFPSGAATWTVMGGTGRYEGATGAGTTENVSERGDGLAWTSKSKGTVTTK